MKASTATAHTVLILEATWLQQGRTLGEADNRFPYGTSRSLYRAKAIYMRIEGDRERKASHFVKGHFSPIAIRPQCQKGSHSVLPLGQRGNYSAKSLHPSPPLLNFS